MRENDWHDARWQAEAREWVTSRLEELGTPVSGAIEHFRVRPWSVTHRVPTAEGDRWFKANITACRYEAALAGALARIAPGATLPPLAVDTTRGWLLTADAGPTLREALEAGMAVPRETPDPVGTAPDPVGTAPDPVGVARDPVGVARDPVGTAPDHADVTLGVATGASGRMLREAVGGGGRMATWVDMLQAYAALQRATVAYAEELVAMGVPNLRVSALPGLLAEALEDPGLRESVDPAVARDFPEWCAELAGDGIPAALQHDDLHDGNVFADLRFFDWGDASIAHPFGSLLVALNVIQDTLDVPNRSPELLRLRDAYLEPWSDLADTATLRRSATLACRVTRLSRALSWQRSLRGAAIPVDDAFHSAPSAWLNELSAETAV